LDDIGDHQDGGYGGLSIAARYRPCDSTPSSSGGIDGARGMAVGAQSEPEALDAWVKGEEDSYSPEITAAYAVTEAVKAVSNGWDELRTIAGIGIFMAIAWLVSALFTGSYGGYGVAVTIVTASILLRKFALNSEHRGSGAMHRYLAELVRDEIRGPKMPLRDE
jgi:hypothetical protein